LAGAITGLKTFDSTCPESPSPLSAFWLWDNPNKREKWGLLPNNAGGANSTNNQPIVTLEYS
jgi:hypothetical protein